MAEAVVAEFSARQAPEGLRQVLCITLLLL